MALTLLKFLACIKGVSIAASYTRAFNILLRYPIACVLEFSNTGVSFFVDKSVFGKLITSDTPAFSSSDVENKLVLEFSLFPYGYIFDIAIDDVRVRLDICCGRCSILDNMLSKKKLQINL